MKRSSELAKQRAEKNVTLQRARRINQLQELRAVIAPPPKKKVARKWRWRVVALVLTSTLVGLGVPAAGRDGAGMQHVPAEGS